MTVDPESLEKAGLPSVPPADRAWMAKLVTAVSKAGALAIGVDFYFTTPTKPEKDEALVKAIRDSKAPVVIAAVSERYLQTEAQRKFLAEFIQRTGGPAGHIGFKRAKEIFSLGDRATRAVYHDDPEPSAILRFSRACHAPEVGPRLAPTRSRKASSASTGCWTPRGTTSPSCNYSAYEVLSPEAGAPAPDLNGKIVLIGPDFAGQDQHTLPFTVGKEKATFFPGVFIHAQALPRSSTAASSTTGVATEQFLLLFCRWVGGGGGGLASS